MKNNKQFTVTIKPETYKIQLQRNDSNGNLNATLTIKEKNAQENEKIIEIENLSLYCKGISIENWQIFINALQAIINKTKTIN